MYRSLLSVREKRANIEFSYPAARSDVLQVLRTLLALSDNVQGVNCNDLFNGALWPQPLLFLFMIWCHEPALLLAVVSHPEAQTQEIISSDSYPILCDFNFVQPDHQFLVIRSLLG